MKKIILLLLFVYGNISVFSQINATTSTGKKVILNEDGTWKYKDGSSMIKEDKGCQESRSGNISVQNNSSKDIYFYYATDTRSLKGVKYSKIKGNSSKTLKYIPLHGDNGRYHWKAVTELADNQTTLQDLEGIGSGTFNIVICETNEVEIDD